MPRKKVEDLPAVATDAFDMKATLQEFVALKKVSVTLKQLRDEVENSCQILTDDAEDALAWTIEYLEAKESVMFKDILEHCDENTRALLSVII